MEQISTSVAETKQVAVEFLKKILTAAPAAGAAVVGLYGNLGSGKTTFIQCLAQLLSVADHITSPTFVIMKSYKISTLNFHHLIHIDAYRLKSGEELKRLGFEKLLSDPSNLILIEWADLVRDILPPDHLKLTFEFIDERTRKIII